MLMICGQDNFAGKNVFEYFRRGDVEIWLEEAMRKLGKDKF